MVNAHQTAKGFHSTDAKFFITYRMSTSLSSVRRNMPLSIKTLLTLLAFSLWTGTIEASHSASHHAQPNKKHISAAKKTDKKFAQYKTAVLEALQKFREKAMQVWGESDTIVPDASINVTYRNNFKQRSIVNYEQGTVKVELAIQPHKAKNAHLVKQELESALEQAMFQGPDERSILDIADNPTPPKNAKPPALAGLIANEDGTPLTPEQINDFKYTYSRAMKTRAITGKDGKKRVIFSTQFSLVPDHIKVRAEKFRDAVDLNSHTHGIPAPLVYAIIETESFFNPTAKSPVPAFGLMQLVPESGARDAYKFLYSEDLVLNDTYLYDSNNNIELGVAYLHMLYFRYLKRIKNPQSRQWTMIAAYNTGVKNVIRSFVGKYSRAKYSSRWSWKLRALNQINKMDSEEVFKHLRHNLPYEETRSYIKKVRDRMGKYNT